MARNRNCKPSRLKAMTHIFLLLSIPFLLAACAHPVHPRYQPISEYSIWRPPVQGYGSLQINKNTYLVEYLNYYIYQNFDSSADEKWLKGAQEYVLYRAGELAKSKGAHSFVVLHKDDWNMVWYKYRRPIGPRFMPGAMVLMRILDKNSSSIPRDGDQVFEVDKLLDSLAKQNIGLAEHQGTPSPHEGTVKISDNRVIRWRSSVITSDSMSVLGLEESPKTEITKTSSGVFDIAMSGLHMVTPVDLLLECVKLADREGYEAFKLEDWAEEEHRDMGMTLRGVWFRTKAHVVLQHHQKNYESLEPVFVVEEIRSNIDTENPQKKR